MLRLILPVLLLLLSTLTVLKAPSNFFWRVQIAVTEFPYITMGASLVLFAACFWFDKYKTAALCMTGVSLVLFCVPIARAYSRAGKLVTETGMAANDANAFSLLRMFSGNPEATPQTFVYKTVKDKNFTLDFYPAVGTTNASCIVVIHGGSWSSGDNTQFVEWNAWLANNGYNVAAINYRLAPEFKSPAQVEDTRDAIRFLQTQQQLNIDTGSFFLLGRSAGGQIALCAAYQPGMPEIKGVISLYAPADMVWGAKIKGNPLVLNTDSVFADYLGGPYDQFAEKYFESSAVQHVTTASPPTLIIHGDNDCMVSFIHSEHLDSALKANNVQHQFLDLPGATHACDYNLNGPSGQLIQFAIRGFLKEAVVE